jgi:hypothetical protein
MRPICSPSRNAARAQQPVLERDELPVERQVGLISALHVQRPASPLTLLIANTARAIDTPFSTIDANWLVAGTRLVHGERPGGGVEREVVEAASAPPPGRRCWSAR